MGMMGIGCCRQSQELCGGSGPFGDGSGGGSESREDKDPIEGMDSGWSVSGGRHCDPLGCEDVYQEFKTWLATVVKLGVSRIAGHVKRHGRRFGEDHHGLIGLYNVVMQDKLKHVSREISQSGAVS